MQEILKVDAARVLMPREAISLIECAVAAIELDRDRARWCLSQVSALLRGEPVAVADTAATVRPRAMRGSFAHWQLSRVMTHIDDHLSGTIRTCDLAGITRVSPSHFFRRFKASTGTTPLMFITRRRIAHACKLMITTNEPLCQIAIECGLCDQPHFTRVFRRIIGDTPSVWRRMNALGPRHQGGKLLT